MIKSFKTVAAAGLCAAILAGVVTPASADRGGDIAAGILGGAIVGGIIGQNTAPRRVYVEPAPAYRSCRELRERALYAEDTGRPDRARYWWNRFHDCRGD